jgi:fumarate reductase subunit C
MNRYLIAFCYLFTIVLLFLVFFIIQAVPSSSPLNIDLYRDNTIISLAIYNLAELSYHTNTTKETLEEPVEHNWDNNWNSTENQDVSRGWNHNND